MTWPLIFNLNIFLKVKSSNWTQKFIRNFIGKNRKILHWQIIKWVVQIQCQVQQLGSEIHSEVNLQKQKKFPVVVNKVGNSNSVPSPAI